LKKPEKGPGPGHYGVPGCKGRGGESVNFFSGKCVGGVQEGERALSKGKIERAARAERETPS